MTMAISKDHSKKAPSQNPTAFYKGEQFGGARGQKTQSVPDQLKGGPMREKIFGNEKSK